MKSLIVVPHIRVKRSFVSDEYSRKPVNVQDALNMVAPLEEVILEPVCFLGIPSRVVANTLGAFVMCLPQTSETILHDVRSNRLGDHLDLIQRAPDRFSTALVCGHNPGIGDLARLLTQETLALPSGAMVGIDLEADSWDEASIYSRGDVAWLWSQKTGFTRTT